MVFPIGAGNPYRTKSGAQSIENASAEIAAAAAHSTDMRFWFVPSPKFPIKGSPMTNLTGGCNASSMCQGGPKDPDNWGCQNECHQDDGNLVHSWTHVTPVTVRPLSAICYIAVERIKAAATPGRAVGIIASYVGGTPVGTWAADDHADKTCHVSGTAKDPKNVPCNPATAYCPGQLFDQKIRPLLPFTARAVLWYQGEANTDEGYTRSREECVTQYVVVAWVWWVGWVGCGVEGYGYGMLVDAKGKHRDRRDMQGTHFISYSVFASPL